MTLLFWGSERRRFFVLTQILNFRILTAPMPFYIAFCSQIYTSVLLSFYIECFSPITQLYTFMRGLTPSYILALFSISSRLPFSTHKMKQSAPPHQPVPSSTHSDLQTSQQPVPEKRPPPTLPRDGPIEAYNKDELIQLLAIMEGELQARDIALAVMRVSFWDWV
jgi:hypothetical protein